MIQVINGEIAQYSLPKRGRGTKEKMVATVSGYHLLDEETLLDEGWLPLEGCWNQSMMKKLNI